VIIAVFAAAVGATVILFGPDMAPVALAGVMVGLFGTLFGTRYLALAAAGAALAATGFGLAVPGWAGTAIAIGAMTGLLGREADRSGSKTFVFGIMAWIILVAPAAAGGGWMMVAVFATATAFGIGVAIMLGAEARIPLAPHVPGYGMALGIATATGLALAFAIAANFDGTHTQWIALMFAARGLDAPGSHRKKAVRTGLGAMAGAAAAGAVLALPLPSIAVTAAGLVMFVLGLRLLPAQSPLSPAFVSAAIILATAPDTAAADFRIMAAAIAAGLAVSLNWAIGAASRLFSTRKI